MMSGFYEVLIQGTRQEVDYTIFRAYTGPRYKQGEIYRGPVYNLGGDTLYTGRVYGVCADCRCNLPLRPEWLEAEPRAWEADGEAFCADCRTEVLV